MPFAMYDYIQSVEVEGTVYVGGGLADKTNNMYIVMAYDTQSCKWHTLPPYSAEEVCYDYHPQQTCFSGWKA